MPEHYGGDTAVMRMFRLRNAQRQGQQLSGEDAKLFDNLSMWGSQNLGVAAPSAPAMPGKPVVSGEDAVPAGDRLSAMAPPQASSEPTGPGNGLLRRRSIPALDALTEGPKKRNRGLIHRRDIGKVM